MIKLPVEPKVLSKEGPNKATFEVSPLYPGYGMTIGNSLRRVLISSLGGAAITSVKIKGALHEFSTVPDVAEDVIEIILNLKKVRFKLFSDEPVLLTLKVSGEKEVTAGDIKTTADAEVINTDQHIASLTSKKGELEMELKVEKGIGYIPVDQREKGKLGVGVIAIDGIFTPIKSVNFKVENIRVDQRTDYNRALLEVETDGSISPEEALQKASKILIDHFNIIASIEVPKESEKPTAKKVAKPAAAKKTAKTKK